MSAHTTQHTITARRVARDDTSGTRLPEAARPADLDGARLTLRQAVASAYRNALVFDGRASRSAFWWFALVAAIVGILVAGAVALLWVFAAPSASPVAALLALFLAWLPLWLPGFTLTGRRLRDTGLSARFLPVLLVPYLGGPIVLLLAARPARRVAEAHD